LPFGGDFPRFILLLGHKARSGGIRLAYNILIGKPEMKRPLGRPRHRWEYTGS